MKIPNHLPYLRNSWDRMDEYHSLDSDVTKEDVILWFAVCFKKWKIQTFKDATDVPEWKMIALCQRTPSNFYGLFEIDFWGGMFHCMGMYGQSFYCEWMPKEFNNSGNDANCKKRFEWIKSEVDLLINS